MRHALLRAGLLLATAVPAGCSAARVVFDVPEPEERPAAAPVGSEAQRPREPLPIEGTLDPDSALALLPRDAAGGVDWVAAIREGVIDPRPGPEGTGPEPGFGYDFYFGEMETAFPHSAHSAWMTCASCHPAIYRTRGVETTMAAIAAGESCGVCHGPVAFGVEVCERCHPAATLPAGRMEAKLDVASTIPRDTTSENARAMGSLPESLFPHWAHRVRFACSACHPEPFAMEAGTSPITMEAMQAGQNCGVCHGGGDAFGVMECTRCHREPDLSEANAE